MKLSIQQNCPACGAAIVLTEESRLVRCDFCNTHNYRCGESPGRYFLPYKLPADMDEEQLIFVPYLRFKGSIFSVGRGQVDHRIVDTTRLAFVDQGKNGLPQSLGLRPQTLQLRPVTAAMKGHFLAQSVPTREAFDHATGVLSIFTKEKNRKNHTYHRAFIGETLSRIYLPCYVRRNCLYDGLLGRKLASLPPEHDLDRQLVGDKHGWEPRYIHTVCPACGGLLGGEEQSVVLRCTNCSRHWRERGGCFTEVPWSVEKSSAESSSLLPFWTIECRVRGEQLESFTDYLNFTGQPLRRLDGHTNRPLIFVVPAFKLRPKTFLQLGAQLTISQQRLPATEKRASFVGHPVTLSSDEAIQAIKTIIAATSLTREKNFPLLPTLRVKQKRISLTYLPFVKKHYQYIHAATGGSLQRAALHYGGFL